VENRDCICLIKFIARLAKRKEISKRLEKFRIIIDAIMMEVIAIIKLVSIVFWVKDCGEQHGVTHVSCPVGHRLFWL
jgi:hypothetical protein